MIKGVMRQYHTWLGLQANRLENENKGSASLIFDKILVCLGNGHGSVVAPCTG